MSARVFIRSVVLSVLLAVAAAPAQQKAAAPAQQKGAAPAEQKQDEGYSKKIREYTTEPFFLTEFVDHLPASDRVPTPEKVLGYIVGTPDRLTYSKDIYRYLRELAKATPRVRVFTMGQSEEGREMVLAVVSDEDNLRQLDRYKQLTARLADPRGLSEAEADKIIAEAKPMYWASGSIHSPETGSPEMLMELAYRLAVEETPFIQAIRKNSIILITPLVEVDGHDRQVDIYRYRKANPNKPAPSLLYWGKYVAHDNNRDNMGMALALSRLMMRNFLEYHPQVLHDLHESVPFLYTSTGTGPYNAWLDPIVVDEWHLLAYHEIEELTKRGVPGVWTHGFYDGWAPNYMFYAANGHNAIGRFYETFGGRGADTAERTVPAASTTRTWFRPNPPLPRVRWSIRNNINLQQSALLLATNFVATHKDRFLRNFYLKSKRSVEKATKEGPAAYAIYRDQRPVEAAELANLMRMQGVEVHLLDKETELKEGKLPEGTYVVRMDQPYSRMADMLLDTQYFNPSDPRPYDDTGWSLGALRNVKTLRITDLAVLKAAMRRLEQEARVEGRIVESAGAGNGPSTTAAFLIDHNTDNTLATFRFRLADVKMLAAEEPFSHNDRKFSAGTFIIPVEGNAANLRLKMEGTLKELGLTAHAAEALPKVATHALAVPRVALLHTWTSTQDEGWYRIAFDQLRIPYSYISDHLIRDTADLRARFDVIVFPPARGGAARLVHGLPMRGEPIPWKATELTPNLGTSPDTTDDMRGGMGFQGLIHLRKFVEEGGALVVVGNNSSVPVGFGLVEGVTIAETRQLQARGTVVNATVADSKSPIVYGYRDKLAVYFNQAPVFRVSLTGGGFGGGGFDPTQGDDAQRQRVSGRGTATDPDIPQGRTYRAPQRPERRSPGEQETFIPEEQREFLRNLLPPRDQWPRVVLRFAEEKDLAVSGMLAGGSELAQRPAVVDVPVGKGHIVLFANNPVWRHQTQGSFFLLFNTLLNYDNLSAGRTSQGPGPRSAAPSR